jgi:hypothetical protein
MAKGKRDLTREARWRGLVAAQRKSELSVRAFCSREQATESAFYAWRREIGRRDQQKAAAKLPAFLPVMMAGMAAGNDGHIVIELREGRVLRVPPVRVTELVRAIEAAS